MASGALAVMETERVRDDGSRFAARIQTVPVGPPGRPVGFVEVVEDITSVKQAAEEREKMLRQLNQTQKMESIGTLAGGIAHDFNNILSGVVGYTDLALAQVEGEGRLRDDLLQVRRAADRAAALAKQILTFSRKGKQVKAPLQIYLVVKEALKLLRASIPSSIEIKQEIKSQGMTLADPTQIHQVIINLCTNAYHAMEEGGGIMEVALQEVVLTEAMRDGDSELPPGPYLKLCVNDTGCGMDEATQARIFEPYFTTKGQGQGTGLGLAVVHGIIKDLGGQITVDSKLGEGSLFSVYLPMITAEPVAAATDTEAPPVSCRHERIMVVDDEETIRALIHQGLTQAGYRVETFVNGAEAWAALSQEPMAWDLVFTDQTMPLMSGDQLAAKAQALRPKLPVIISSGFNTHLDEARVQALGVKACLQKPVGITPLLKAVAAALAG